MGPALALENCPLGRGSSRSHQPGWLTFLFVGSLAHLIALVEQLDLLHFLKGFVQSGLGLLKLELESAAECLRFSRRCMAALA